MSLPVSDYRSENRFISNVIVYEGRLTVRGTDARGYPMTEEHIPKMDSADDDKIDIASLFRGTSTVAFVTFITSGIATIGSFIVYLVSRPGGLISNLNMDTAIFLLLLGAMITLFIFLGTIGFFVRVNRRMGNIVISEDLEAVDLSRPGVKTVIVMYGLAVGLILIMGMWGYWLLYKYYLGPLAATSLSFLAFSISLGLVIMSILVEVVLVAIGRTATSMVRKVLAMPE